MAEIKAEVSRMTLEEQRELAGFLMIQTRMNDPEWVEKTVQTIREMQAGNAYSEADLLALEAKLQAEGR